MALSTERPPQVELLGSCHPKAPPGELESSPIQPDERSLLEMCNKITRRLTLDIGFLSQCWSSQHGDGLVGIAGWGGIGMLQNQTGAAKLDRSGLVDMAREHHDRPPFGGQGPQERPWVAKENPLAQAGTLQPELQGEMRGPIILVAPLEAP